MARLLITDGYTLDGSFNGAPFGLPNVAFKFRPASPEAVYDYQQAMGRATSGADQLKAVVDLLIPRTGDPRILSWDIDGDKDQMTAPVSAATIRRLPPPLLTHLVNVVSSYTPAQQVADAKN